MRETRTAHGTPFWTGVRLGIPVILGYIPVGIAYAIIARQAGFSILETCMMSVFVYAGASEIMAAGMYAQGAGIAAIVLATFILNLRHFIMSACVMNGMRSESRGFKQMAAFGVTDETFSIYTTQKKTERPGLVFLGMALVAYLSWNAGTLIGAVASNFLPAFLTAALGVAMYAMFIALLMPNLHGNGRLALLVVFTGVVNMLLSQVMASGWALIAATLLGAAAGIPFVKLPQGEEGPSCEN